MYNTKDMESDKNITDYITYNTKIQIKNLKLLAPYNAWPKSKYSINNIINKYH